MKKENRDKYHDLVTELLELSDNAYDINGDFITDGFIALIRRECAEAIQSEQVRCEQEMKIKFHHAVKSRNFEELNKLMPRNAGWINKTGGNK